MLCCWYISIVISRARINRPARRPAGRTVDPKNLPRPPAGAVFMWLRFLWPQRCAGELIRILGVPGKEIEYRRCKPDSVSWQCQATTIHLCDLPGTIRRCRTVRTTPYSCSTLLREGFTLQLDSHPGPVGSYPTISPLPRRRGGIFSVALSCPWHLVHGIPDFSGTPCPAKSGLSSEPSTKAQRPSPPIFDPNKT